MWTHIIPVRKRNVRMSDARVLLPADHTRCNQCLSYHQLSRYMSSKMFLFVFVSTRHKNFLELHLLRCEASNRWYLVERLSYLFLLASYVYIVRLAVKRVKYARISYFLALAGTLSPVLAFLIFSILASYPIRPIWDSFSFDSFFARANPPARPSSLINCFFCCSVIGIVITINLV